MFRNITFLFRSFFHFSTDVVQIIEHMFSCRAAKFNKEIKTCDLPQESEYSQCWDIRRGLLLPSNSETRAYAT